MTQYRQAVAPRQTDNEGLSALRVGPETADFEPAISVEVSHRFRKFPIASNDGSAVGGKGNSSVNFDDNETFTNEVAFGTAFDSMEDGDYWVDHERGIFHGKTAKASGTITFFYDVITPSREILTNQHNIQHGTVANGPVRIMAEEGVKRDVLIQNVGDTEKLIATIIGEHEDAEADKGAVIFPESSLVLSTDKEISIVAAANSTTYAVSIFYY